MDQGCSYFLPRVMGMPIDFLSKGSLQTTHVSPLISKQWLQTLAGKFWVMMALLHLVHFRRLLGTQQLQISALVDSPAFKGLLHLKHFPTRLEQASAQRTAPYRVLTSGSMKFLIGSIEMKKNY